MFRICFLVEDKYLAGVLTNLTNKVRELSVVLAVNAEPAPNGKVRVKHGDWPNAFMAEVRARKLTELNATRVRSILTDMGGSETSYSHVLNRCVSMNMLKIGKKSGTGFIYHVLPVK